LDETWLTLRVRTLNDYAVQNGDYVLYWMQSAQRVDYNQALEYAIIRANKLNKPLVVLFVLTNYPEANLRHYTFMIEGLRETIEDLNARGIQFILKLGDPSTKCLELAERSSILVLDRGYQKTQKKWYNQIGSNAKLQVVQIESDVVVPLEAVSDKEEYMAVHYRRRITPLLKDYIINVPNHELSNTTTVNAETLDLRDKKLLYEKLQVDQSVKLGKYRGGRGEAIKLFEDFMDNKLADYPEDRNDPNNDKQSNMSPYLHFGQISPIELALKALEEGGRGSEEFIEQLIVRRELAFNMVHYNLDYDNINCLPRWALETLHKHASDPRPYIYTLEEFESAQTHDQYWNKAQIELVKTGKMHGYMRMYWGKKILEWSEDPETAYKTALFLNNKYELDGRSCNGYTGVAWCFGKHDQAWKERKIFGKVRYMNDKGLERKYNMKKYLTKTF
jgi:deoxyribodipyrimidine photo-lyase